jgi:hypothetical protein
MCASNRREHCHDNDQGKLRHVCFEDYCYSHIEPGTIENIHSQQTGERKEQTIEWAIA